MTNIPHHFYLIQLFIHFPSLFFPYFSRFDDISMEGEQSEKLAFIIRLHINIICFAMHQNQFMLSQLINLPII